MKKKIVIIILSIFLIAPLTAVRAADVTFSTDTVLSFSSPVSTTVVALAGGNLDQIVVNSTAGTIAITISAGQALTLRSMDKYTLTPGTNSDIGINASCQDAYHEVILTPQSTASSDTLTITLGSASCSANAGGSANPPGGGGSSGSSSSGSQTTTTTQTTTETETAETTTEETTQTAETTTTTTESATQTATVGEPARDAKGNVTLNQMNADALNVASGDVSQLTAALGVARDTAKETEYSASIVAKITKDSGVTAQVRNTINNFVTYGTPATKMLGAGERGGVVNSYRAAFGKLPATTEEWNDVVKIANGRWPSSASATAEARAKTSFKTIYLREANMSNANDNAAVTVMAYGLRPANRNLDSEKTAIKTFKAIFGYNPTSATNWDAVRAIAYSGATR
ncbi:MAG: hypothetical protein Q8Q23_01870 [bacterium]|nr:hypothetical protein [bacterium]